MIVDTSAVVAVLRDEPEAGSFIDALVKADRCRMSAATFVEASVVVDANRDPVLSRRFDDLLVTAGVQIEPVTVEQAVLARQAYVDFGKGSGHPARLNLGDCFAYALARATGEALLYKGDDFSATDLPSAVD